nr:fibronectin type III domain-containing protein [Acidimicrobiia bacterium]
VEALAGWHAATFTITPGAGGSPATAYEVTLRDGTTVVDTATVPANGDLSVTFGDLDTGTTYTATVVATNGAGDSAPATATATPFVPADTTGLDIDGRACPNGSSITWTVDNDLDIPVSFNWIARTADTSGTAVVEANSSTQVTTDFAGPTRNVFRVVVDRILQDREQSRRAEFCNPVMNPI